MLEVRLQVRREQYERKIRDLTYDLQEIDKNRAQIKAALAELSGAVYEIDNVLKDIAAQAAEENNDA